jgi:asparagine synthase (glutamine-hydrolysing)
VGNFLVVISGDSHSTAGHQSFRRMLDAAIELKRQRPFQIKETTVGRVASFPRWNGSACAIAVDERSGNWLLTSGTWFHSSGLASREENGLLRRYQEVGAKHLAQELEGFFVVIIGDVQNGCTYAITDLIGSCHAFLSRTSDGVSLSGSSLLLASPGDYELDALACQEFLNLGVIYEDRTLFKNVRKLRPASIYRFEKGTLLSVEQYWSVTQLRLESYDGHEAAEALWSKLCRGASRIEKLFPKPICDLTGGYDSRTLVSAFIGAGYAPSTVVSGPAQSRDVRVSRDLAKLADLEHRYVRTGVDVTTEGLRHALQITDGEYDLVECHRILSIHSELSSEFDASCNGSFGEVARGFWWEVLWPHTGDNRPLDAMAVARLRYATGSFDSDLFARARRVDMTTHMGEVIKRTGGSALGIPNTSLMDQVYLWMRMQRWQGRIASSTNQIWPCLSPFMFRSVLEVMLETQARFRRRSLLIRMMLERFQPKWAQIALEHGYPAVPATWKNLHRFFPLVNYYGWKIVGRVARRLGIRSHLARPSSCAPFRRLGDEEEVNLLLSPSTMRSISVLDADSVARFLKRSKEGDFPYTDQWCRLLTLELTLNSLSRLRPT